MFGDNLKKLRKSKKMSSVELASMLNVSTATMSRYENNLREPDFDTLKKLSAIFNVSVDYLLDIDIKYVNEKEDSAMMWFKLLSDEEKQKIQEIWKIIQK